MMPKKKVLIVGSGLAGLYLAGKLDSSTEVVLLSENDFFNSNSYLAKGGIAIPFSDDDAVQHVEDTLDAGDGLCDRNMVTQVVEQGRKLIGDLANLGFVFDQSISREGGHRSSRVRHVGDETGRHLTDHLWSVVRQKSNIRIQSGYAVTDLIVEQGRCCGVMAYSSLFQRLVHLHADTVVIAGGGCSNLYLRNTGNGFANGEMIALASKYGAQVNGLEFMQFHPTMVYQKGVDNNTLVTEALRGAGAVVEDHQGNDIMSTVHPLGSLAPRDILSRTVYRNMMQHQKPHVWLNYQSVSQHEMQQRFPALSIVCIKNGFNKRIPITPAAHYTCGGISAGMDGATSVAGLLAIGEAASTGLHGANRLASNSLLELLVMADFAATRLNTSLEPTALKTDREVSMCSNTMYDSIRRDHQQIRTIMWRHFGIVRSVASMRSGLLQLNKMIAENANKHSIDGTRLSNRLTCASLIAEAALSRTESVGCHYVEESEINTDVYETSSLSQSA